MNYLKLSHSSTIGNKFEFGADDGWPKWEKQANSCLYRHYWIFDTQICINGECRGYAQIYLAAKICSLLANGSKILNLGICYIQLFSFYLYLTVEHNFPKQINRLKLGQCASGFHLCCTTLGWNTKVLIPICQLVF